MVDFNREEDRECSKSFEWEIQDGGAQWTRAPDEIADMSDPMIIEGMLREGEVTSVVGGAKSCKTWFSLALALAVARGEAFLGFAVNRQRVLYLDYELKPGTFRKRMCMSSSSRPNGFLYQLVRGEAQGPSVEELAEIVRKEEIGLVVVDSLYRTGWLSEENSNDSTGRELALLQGLASATGVTVLTVDHTAKGGGGGRSAVDASRGASTKGGFFDAIFVLRPSDKGPKPEDHYVILDPVVRDWPSFKSLPLLYFSWTENSVEIDRVGEVDGKATNADSVILLGFLSECEKPCGVTEIANETSLSSKRVRESLSKLVSKGKVVEFTDPKHKQRRLFRLPDMVA